MGAFACAVTRAVRPGCGRRFCHFLMVKMGRSPDIVLVVSYRFGSVVVLAVLLGLRVLYLPGSHLRGHRVAHPAAQRQQGDQEGEEQVAHE
jgi:hypothetical protein